MVLRLPLFRLHRGIPRRTAVSTGTIRGQGPGLNVRVLAYFMSFLWYGFHESFRAFLRFSRPGWLCLTYDA